jgi:N6-adenosine-specific RNA methylase IME4
MRPTPSPPSIVVLDSLAELRASYSGAYSDLLMARHLSTVTLPFKPYCGAGRGERRSSCALDEVDRIVLDTYERYRAQRAVLPSKVPAPTTQGLVNASKKRAFDVPFVLQTDAWCGDLLHSKRVYFFENKSIEQLLVKLSPDISAVIPSNSTAVVSDLSMFNEFFTRFECGFPTVVADPPWHSRSVRRASAYWSRNAEAFPALKDLLLGMSPPPCSTICVWVTNDPKVVDFTVDKLIPQWLGGGAVCYSQVVWVKVTVQGEVVVPFGNPQRKCYERCVVGRRATEPWAGGHIPITHVIFSSPLWHSTKPSLDRVLNLDPGLELFARQPRSGWVVWGNQSLMRVEV